MSQNLGDHLTDSRGQIDPYTSWVAEPVDTLKVVQDLSGTNREPRNHTFIEPYWKEPGSIARPNLDPLGPSMDSATKCAWYIDSTDDDGRKLGHSRRSKTRPPDHDWTGDLVGGLGTDQAAAPE